MKNDYQAEEKKLLADIAALRADRIGAADSIDVLRELRGYHMVGGNVAGFESHPEIWDVKTETEKEEAHVLRFQIQGCGKKGI